ncbi:MAG: HAMP domain-containing histidine kinase [Deltaproteobacteria bacterium]|nr:HAMP domain-containing histidine kinase [Deltaproteobacteria bacterium]
MYGRPYTEPTVHEGGMSSEGRVRVVATEFLRARPLVVAPLFLLALITLLASDAQRAQVVAVAVVGTIAIAVFTWERAVGRSKVVTATFLTRSLVATMIGISCVSAATGALASPFLPMLFAPVGVGFAAFGRARAGRVLLAVWIALVVALALLTSRVADLALPLQARHVVLGAAMIDAAVLLYFGVASLSAAHARAAQQLAVAGDEMARAASARARSLEMMSAQLAHEVKNPLAAIRALVEVMLESSDERATKRLSVAKGEVARIETLVDAYGSLQRPLESVVRAPCDVDALLVALVALLEARAERRGITLAVERIPPPALPFPLDRDRTKEALLNLLLNAIDATAAGGRVVLRAVPAGDDLDLSVTDDGVGMDAETLARIGTPFFTRREGGTGLGVLLARRVAEQHGGSLDYASQPGRGTTATLRIRRANAERETSHADRPRM